MLSRFLKYSAACILAASCSFPLSGQNNNALKYQPSVLTSFKHRDIGNPSIPGTVKTVKNGFDVTGGGADIWGTKDEFNYIYIEKTGDFDVVTRVESMMAANLYSKAGIMAREDLTPDSRHVYFQVFSDNNPRNENNGGYEFQYRKTKGTEMIAIYPKTSTGTPLYPIKYPDTWIRLKRTGDDFTGFVSFDGKSWREYTTFRLPMTSKIFVGFAVTSHNTGHSASVRFRNIGELKH